MRKQRLFAAVSNAFYTGMLYYIPVLACVVYLQDV